MATATAAAGDHVAGDVGIELAPDLSQSLTDIAIEKCGTPSKRMKRSATFASCALNFAEEATNGGSAPLGAEGAPTLPSTLAGDIGDVIAAGKAAGVITEANVGVYTVALIALEAFFANAAAGKAAHVPLNLIIPTAALKPTTTAKTAATQTTSSSSTSSAVIPVFHTGFIDLNYQQTILSSWAALVASSTLPSTASTSSAAPSATAVCDKSSMISLASSAVNSFSDVFCDTVDLTKDASKIVSGADLTNATTVATGIVGTFNFKKYATNCADEVQSCKDGYNSLISHCEFTLLKSLSEVANAGVKVKQTVC